MTVQTDLFIQGYSKETQLHKPQMTAQIDLFVQVHSKSYRFKFCTINFV